MATDNSNLGSCVVVVGDPRGELVQTTMRLAREGEIDAVACDNVYGAVAQIAKAAGRRVLAVGTMQELARENGAFFRIAAAHAVQCCCLLDRTGPAGREGNRAPQCEIAHLATRTQDLLAALGAGVTILGAVPDVRSVLKEWLATPQPRGARPVSRDAAPAGHRRGAVAEAADEEFRATEAELSALLG